VHYVVATSRVDDAGASQTTVSSLGGRLRREVAVPSFAAWRYLTAMVLSVSASCCLLTSCGENTTPKRVSQPTKTVKKTVKLIRFPISISEEAWGPVKSIVLPSHWVWVPETKRDVVLHRLPDPKRKGEATSVDAHVVMSKEEGLDSFRKCAMYRSIVEDNLKAEIRQYGGVQFKRWDMTLEFDTGSEIVWYSEELQLLLHLTCNENEALEEFERGLEGAVCEGVPNSVGGRRWRP